MGIIYMYILFPTDDAQSNYLKIRGQNIKCIQIGNI